MSLRVSTIGVSFVAFILLLITGCTNQHNVSDDRYLIRIDDTVVTGKDYLDALEVMKASYPYEALQDARVIRTLKTRLLKQMTEELILTRRAKDLGLSVSDDEIEKAVNAIKADYPNGLFKKTLQERAIPFTAWKKRLAMRLLTEKIIDRELAVKINLTPEEVKNAYREYFSVEKTGAGIPESIDADFVKQLRREKAQKLYPQWINTLQQQYNIELNEQRWKTIFN
jgi:FKBP-type peptidyl-prolyl cis-trans isomerase (trigger factor)